MWNLSGLTLMRNLFRMIYKREPKYFYHQSNHFTSALIMYNSEEGSYGITLCHQLKIVKL